MQVSPGLLQDKYIPLDVRTALANAALAYANVLAQCNGNMDEVPEGFVKTLVDAAEDVYVCGRAATLGMVEGND